MYKRSTNTVEEFLRNKVSDLHKAQSSRDSYDVYES